MTHPWVSKRDAAAKAEAARSAQLLEAQTQQDIERIKRGQATYEGGKLLSTTAPGAFSTPALPDATSRRIEPHFGPVPQTAAEFAQAANTQAEVLNLERSLALHRITRFAEEEAEQHEDDSIVSDEPIDPDWFARWRASAQDVRSEDMQRLWARILVGEARAPGAYSLHSLDFIARISRQEAEQFVKLARYAINDWVFHDANASPATSQFKFSELLDLQELSLVFGVDGNIALNLKSTKNDKFQLAFRYGRKCIEVRHIDSARILAIPILKFSRIGRELLSLCHAPADEKLLPVISDFIKKSGFEVSICDVVKMEGDIFHYANCQDV